MISKEKLKEKAREMLENLEFQGYEKKEIAYLGACFQNYAVYGDLAFIPEVMV